MKKLICVNALRRANLHASLLFGRIDIILFRGESRKFNKSLGELKEKKK